MAMAVKKKTAKKKAQVEEKAAEVCDQCKFYNNVGREGVGNCRRYPPEAVTSSGFPIVKTSDWCGEFLR